MIIEIKGYDIDVDLDISGKKFFDNFDFDSIEIMELLIKIEEEFFEIAPDEKIISILNDCDALLEFIKRGEYNNKNGNV